MNDEDEPSDPQLVTDPDDKNYGQLIEGNPDRGDFGEVIDKP